MRFMAIIKSSEKSGPPPMALIDAIGKLNEEARQAGVLLEVGGLLPSIKGARVRLASGNLTVTDGPFAETKEHIGGYAIFNVPSKEAAIEYARQFLHLHHQHWPEWEGECELRQCFEGGTGRCGEAM